ncbi:MAG: hypothetical protein ABI411_00910 [Tahibacter sp.]
MSEFEWRRGMRDLGGPVQPGRDLWLDIAARIEGASAQKVAAPARSHRWVPYAAAASVLLGLLVSLQWLPAGRSSQETASLAKESPEALFTRTNASLRAARPDDPRLAGAVVELDAAATQIEQMLVTQPDAVFLVGLLNRTNERRLKLARLGQTAG